MGVVVIVPYEYGSNSIIVSADDIVEFIVFKIVYASRSITMCVSN